jgi:bacillithiol biosynthesis deacetylase BshB1
MSVDVLAFGPHPDDVEIRCGGLLLRCIESGRSAAIVDITRGETGTRGTADERAEEAEQGRRTLGVAVRENLGLPDGFVEPTREAKLAVVATLRRHRPALVLAPYPRDLHPDHAATGRLVEGSLFLAGLRKVGEGEPHRPTTLLFYMCHHPFVPTLVVDVTSVFDRKLQAIRCYGSQLHRPGVDAPRTDIGSPDFEERLVAWHRTYGTQVGVRYGEPYFAHRPLGIQDPASALLDPAPEHFPPERSP